MGHSTSSLVQDLQRKTKPRVGGANRKEKQLDFRVIEVGVGRNRVDTLA